MCVTVWCVCGAVWCVYVCNSVFVNSVCMLISTLSGQVSFVDDYSCYSVFIFSTYYLYEHKLFNTMYCSYDVALWHCRIAGCCWTILRTCVCKADQDMRT